MALMDTGFFGTGNNDIFHCWVSTLKTSYATLQLFFLSLWFATLDLGTIAHKPQRWCSHECLHGVESCYQHTLGYVILNICTSLGHRAIFYSY